MCSALQCAKVWNIGIIFVTSTETGSNAQNQVFLTNTKSSLQMQGAQRKFLFFALFTALCCFTQVFYLGSNKQAAVHSNQKNEVSQLLSHALKSDVKTTELDFKKPQIFIEETAQDNSSSPEKNFGGANQLFDSSKNEFGAYFSQIFTNFFAILGISTIVPLYLLYNKLKVFC